MKLLLLTTYHGLASSLVLHLIATQSQPQNFEHDLVARAPQQPRVELPEIVNQRPAYVPDLAEDGHETSRVITDPEKINVELQLAQQYPKDFIVTKAAQDALREFRPIYNRIRAANEDYADSSKAYEKMLPKIELVVSYHKDGTSTIRLGPGAEVIDPKTTSRDAQEFMMYLEARPDELHEELMISYFKTHRIALVTKHTPQTSQEATESSQGKRPPPDSELPHYVNVVGAWPAHDPEEEDVLPDYKYVLAEGLIEEYNYYYLQLSDAERTAVDAGRADFEALQAGWIAEIESARSDGVREIGANRASLPAPYRFMDGSSPYGPPTAINPTTEREGITGVLLTLAIIAYTHLTPTILQNTVTTVRWGIDLIRTIGRFITSEEEDFPWKRAGFPGKLAEYSVEQGDLTGPINYKREGIISKIESDESTNFFTNNTDSGSSSGSASDAAAAEFLSYLSAYRTLQSQASSIILPYISLMLNTTTISTLGLPRNLTYLAARSIYVDLTGAPEVISSPFYAGFSGLSPLNDIFFNSTGGVNATLETILAKQKPNITDVATLRFFMGNEKLGQVYSDTFRNASQGLLRANVTQNMLLFGLSLQTNDTKVWPAGFGTKVMPDTLSQYFTPPAREWNKTG